MRVERILSLRSRVYADLVYRFADSADVFSRRADLEPDFATPVEMLTEAAGVKEQSGSVGYAWSGRRTRVNLSANLFKEDYIDTVPHSSRQGFGLQMLTEFNLTEKTGTRLRGEIQDSKLTSESTAHESSVEWALFWRPFESIVLSGGASYFARHGVAIGRYDEVRYVASVGWSPRQFRIAPGTPLFNEPGARRVGVSRR
jgi:hypothetical protein